MIQKKILFLGDSSETKELLQQAKAEGFYTIVTDYFEPEHSTSKLLADEYWMLSTGDLDALEERCRQEEIRAVTSGASEYNIGMTIQLCERLGLPCFCTEAVWNASKNKVVFKQLAKEAGLPVPKEYELSGELTEAELSKVKFPVMVKPSNLCSSIGISYCYTKEQLVEAYRFAEALSAGDKIIVEQMLTGREFFSYYVLAEGEAVFLTLGVRLSQPGKPGLCYSMNTSVNNFTDRYLAELNTAVIEMIKRHHCREGIICVQCMMDGEENFYALEMCYSAETSVLLNPLRKVCDFDPIKWQLDCAVGRKHTAEQLAEITPSPFLRCANSYVLFSSKEGVISEIGGFDALKEFPNVDICIHAYAGDSFRKYYPFGHIMFDTDNYEQICEMIQLINKNVYVKDTDGENMLIYFDDFEAVRELFDGN